MSFADIYAIDKRCAEICRDMTVAGFGFDTQRAATFSAKLRNLEVQAREDASAAAGGEFNPFSYKQLAKVLFHKFAAPVYSKSELTGMPSMGAKEMMAYTASKDAKLSRLALAVLAARRTRKVRSTYIENIIVEADGRVHPGWQNFGTVSGRWSCQSPNLQNLPRHAHDPCAPEGGIRSLYCAAPGSTLVSFDCSQLEFRIAAYASGDANMIAACESGDIHSTNAAMVFGKAFTDASKEEKVALRNLAKTAGFAIIYGAVAETVFENLQKEGVQVALRAVSAMLAQLRKGFSVYYKYSAANYDNCVRVGYVSSPILGRRRWLGHDPPPNEVSNFPIQSGGADHVTLRLLELAPRLPASAIIVAQVHDSATIECPTATANGIAALARQIFEAPQRFTTSGRELWAKLPVDIKIGERWS